MICIDCGCLSGVINDDDDDDIGLAIIHRQCWDQKLRSLNTQYLEKYHNIAYSCQIPKFCGLASKQLISVMPKFGALLTNDPDPDPDRCVATY